MNSRALPISLLLYLCGSLGVVLLASNAYWYFKWSMVEYGSAELRKHARVECHTLDAIARLLVGVTSEQRRESILGQARRVFPDALQVGEQDSVQVDQFVLVFAEDGRLIGVERANNSHLCTNQAR